MPEPLLMEIPLKITPYPLNDRAAAFLEDARGRMRQVDCFDFVPSNYELAWNVLAGLPRGRFCEWGSGLGVAVGLAEILGFEAMGVELDEPLAESSRELLGAHDLMATIRAGSYFDRVDPCDYYYVYAWPSQCRAVQDLFLQQCPPHSKLLICEGQDDIRLRIKPG